MFYILAFIVGALCYRIRGGGAASLEIKLLGDELPTSIRRAFWAIGVGMLLVPEYGIGGLLAMATLYGMVCLPYFFNGQFNLFDPANRNIKNYAALTLKGISLCLPTAIVLSMLVGHPTAFGGAIAGALFVPCYLIWAKVGNRFGNVGEMLLGGLMAVGLVL